MSKTPIDIARIKSFLSRSEDHANGWRYYFMSYTGKVVKAVTKPSAIIKLRHDTEAEMIAIKESKAANGFTYQEESHVNE